MWYAGLAFAEVKKPLIFINEVALFGILAKLLGASINAWWIVGGYVILLVVAVGIGKFIVWSGIVAYNTRLGNQQNPELVSILNSIEKIDKKVNSKEII